MCNSLLEIQIPSAGLGLKSVQCWDCRLVSAKAPPATYDGVDILLYESSSVGQGVHTDATNTIPQGPTPPYSFALSLGEASLLTYCEEVLDGCGYYTQSGTVNTAANPYGYMVVSSTGKTVNYTLPARPGGKATTVTLGAPANGQVTLTIPGGGLSAHSRAQLKNLDTGDVVSFEADGGGAATVLVPGAAGHRLAVAVEAVSSTDPATLVWRPKITLDNGHIQFAFHYYHYVEHWCNAEGDGWVNVGLKVDRTEAFRIQPYVIGTGIDLPWWAHVLGFLADLVTGGLANVVVMSILVETLGPQIVTNLVGSKLESVLESQLKFPTPGAGRLALFLEDIAIYATGFILSGYADTGMVLHYGRRAVKVGAKASTLLGSGGNCLTLHLEPSTAGNSANVSTFFPCSLASIVDPVPAFWSAGYEEGVAAQYGTSAVDIQAGQPALLWIQHASGYAKVLLAFDSATSMLSATWVLYQQRVMPSVQIDNHITATTVSSVDMTIAVACTYRYSGWLELDAIKFFRTPITREAGLERWTWDGMEIPQSGSVTQPGVMVSWDTKADRILVDVDQSGIAKQTPSGQVGLYVPQQHVVTYDGTDAFGAKMSAQLNLNLPAGTCDSKRLLYDVTVWPNEILPDPPWIDRGAEGRRSWVSRFAGFEEAVTSSLRQQIGDHPLAQELIGTLAKALTRGHSRIGAAEAHTVISLLHGRG